MLLRRALLLVLVALAAPTQAQDRAAFAQKAARRFPQPVRVGDLIGHDVLEPKERQTHLGRASAFRRGADGGIDLLVRTGGFLGFGTRLVAVPVEAVALLGEHIALMDISPADLAALPTAAEGGPDIPPSEIIRIGLTRPFH